MIPFPTHIWLAVEPVDMRWGIDQLSHCIQHALAKSPCDGTVYVFSNRRRSRLKLLQWDGTGVWLCQRRLHRGSFVWPTVGDTVCSLSAQEWNWLITGVDWQRLTASPQHWRL